MCVPTWVATGTPTALPLLQNLHSWTDSIWINIPAANISKNQRLVSTRYPDGNGFETGYNAALATLESTSRLRMAAAWVGYGTIPYTLSSDSLVHDHLDGHGGSLNLYVNGQLVGMQANLTSGQTWNSSLTPLFMIPTRT